MSERAILWLALAAAFGCGAELGATEPAAQPTKGAPAAELAAAKEARRASEAPAPSRCERADRKLALGSKLGSEGFALRAERLLEGAIRLCPARESAARALIARDRQATSELGKSAPPSADGTWAAAEAARAKGDLVRARRLASLGSARHRQAGVSLSTWSALAELGVLALSRDGSALLADTGSGELVILAGRTLTPRLFLEPSPARASSPGGHRARVAFARFSQSADRVAVIEDGAVVLFDLVTGARTKKLEWAGQRIEAFDFAPDGASVVTASTEGFDVILRRFDARTGDSQAELRLPQAHSVAAFAMSADGARVAVGGRRGPIELVDGKQLTKTRTLSPKSPEPPLALAFSPTGDRLASVSQAASLEVFVTSSGKALARAGLERPWRTTLLGFSPDGARIRVVGGTWGEALMEIDAASGEALTSRQLLRGNAVLSADGSTIAMSEERGGVSVVDVATGKAVAEARSPSTRVEALAVTDGHLALARQEGGGADSRVELFVASVRKEPYFISTPGYKAVLALSRHGQRLAGHFGGRGVRVWEVGTGAARELPDAPEWVDALTFSRPDRIRGAGGPFELRLFSLELGAAEWSDDLRMKREPGSRAVALSPERAVVSGKDLLIFDFRTKRVEHLAVPKGVESVALSADSSSLVTVSERGTERLALPGGSPRQLVSGRCKRGPVRLSEDGSTILVGCSYRELALIRTSGEAIVPWETSRAELSPSGELLVTESNGSVTIAGADAKPRVTLELGGPGRAVATTRSGEIERFGAAELADRSFCRAGNRVVAFELCEDAFYRDHLLEDALAEAL